MAPPAPHAACRRQQQRRHPLPTLIIDGGVVTIDDIARPTAGGVMAGGVGFLALRRRRPLSNLADEE